MRQALPEKAYSSSKAPLRILTVLTDRDSGTGSSNQGFSCLMLVGSNKKTVTKNRISLSRAEVSSKPKLISPEKKLNTINKAFGLAVSDYSKIFGVERATYYNWLKGMSPNKDETLSRIDKLLSIAERVGKFNKHRYGRLAKTHSFGSDTLLSLLLIESLDEAKILEICQQLSQMLDARASKKRKSAHGNTHFHSTTLNSDF